MDYHRHVAVIAQEDADGLTEARKSYGDSWKSRGGVGAFMNLSRKWDRLEAACQKEGYDIFAVAAKDNRIESLYNDIRDLRRYLNLVEAECRERFGAGEGDRDIKQIRQNQQEELGLDGESQVFRNIRIDGQEVLKGSIIERALQHHLHHDTPTAPPDTLTDLYTRVATELKRPRDVVKYILIGMAQDKTASELLLFSEYEMALIDGVYMEISARPEWIEEVKIRIQTAQDSGVTYDA